MKLYQLLFELLAFICIVKAATLEYTKEGVLRKDSKCSINFVNFGIDSDITGITASLSGTTLTVGNLKNGNEGVNNDSFSSDEIPKYIKISQNGKEITNFTMNSYSNGIFSLKINGISNCDGLTIKQTYKYNVLLHSYLLYANKIPSPINKSFPSDQFGPSSNDIPYDKLYWNMNGGLDELREKCRIYVKYNSKSGNHFIWYLSTENINGENCTNSEFYKIARKYFVDYKVMDELFGDYYEAYVLKRETGNVGHMDGIVNSNYIIEVYQEQCGIQNKNQVICTISSDSMLSFDQFTEELRKNCLSIIVNKDEVGNWTANSSNVIGQFENYSIKVENNGKGALPKTNNEIVNYKTFSYTTSTGATVIMSGVARFKVSFVCKEGTWQDEKCRCQACSLGCGKCASGSNCDKCNDGSLIEGKCECSNDAFMNKEGKCQKCGDDCTTCKDAETCTACKDPLKHLVDGKCECGTGAVLTDGKCECPAGTYMDNMGNCNKCGEDCTTCENDEECTECKDPLKHLNDGKCECGEGATLTKGKCECPVGTFMNNEGNCEKCDENCTACENGETCTSCKDPLKHLVDGKCECGNGATLKDGKCECSNKNTFMDNIGNCQDCDENCTTCENALTCTACKDPLKHLVNGKCLCGDGATLTTEGKCECPTGTYMDQDGNCNTCDEDCSTCENGEECTACKDPFKHLVEGRCECGKDATLTTDGQCECPRKMHMNIEGNCQNCGPECATCKNAESCTSCIDPLKHLVDGKCLCGEGAILTAEGKCECPDGNYMDEDGNCNTCAEDCATCENGETCTTCRNTTMIVVDGKCKCGEGATLVDGDCVCPTDNYMDKDNNCQSCLEDCATCENGNACTACKDPLKHLVEGKCLCGNGANLVNGKCECPAGNYMDKDGNCHACAEDCSTCENGESCTACKDSLKHLIDGKCLCGTGASLTDGKCECPSSGYMGDDANCHECNEDCTTCENGESCTSCKDPLKHLVNGNCLCGDGANLTNEGKCECPAGNYMDEDGNCHACAEDCATCDNSETCTTCKDPLKHLVDGQCECGRGATLKDGKCQCSAESTYMDDMGNCQQCDEDCTTCENAESCTTCKDPLKLLVNGKCICGDGATLTAEGKCECPTGTYMSDDRSCHTCGEDCSACENGEECTACKNPLKHLVDGKCECGKDATLTADGQCECPSKMHMNIEGNCQDCGSECATCENAESCTSCIDPLKHLVDGKCLCGEGATLTGEGKCECPAGKYMDKDGNCRACSEDCATCENGETCTTCKNTTKIIVDGKCQCNERQNEINGVCVCKESYYEDPLTHACKKCDPSCATCNESGRCTTCKDERATISDGVCVCKNSYLTGEGNCFICDKSCKKCNEHGCVACSDPSKTPDENGKC